MAAKLERRRYEAFHPSERKPSEPTIDELVKAGRLQDAKLLGQSYVGKYDSLWLHAWLSEIDHRLGVTPGAGLELYVKGIPENKEGEVLSEAERISKIDGFSKQTIDRIRKAVSLPAARAQLNEKRQLLLAEENRVRKGGNAGPAFLCMLVAWGIVLFLLSATFDWTPRTKGPVKTITLTVGGGVFDKCLGGVSIGTHCYPKGTSFEVVQETADAICIATPYHPKECYRRNLFLQVASLGTGTVNDYSNTLSSGARVWWLVWFPLVAWVLLSFVVKKVRIERVRAKWEVPLRDLENSISHMKEITGEAKEKI